MWERLKVENREKIRRGAEVEYRVRMAQGRVGDNKLTRRRYSQTLTVGRSWRHIAFFWGVAMEK